MWRRCSGKTSTLFERTFRHRHSLIQVFLSLFSTVSFLFSLSHSLTMLTYRIDRPKDICSTLLLSHLLSLSLSVTSFFSFVPSPPFLHLFPTLIQPFMNLSNLPMFVQERDERSKHGAKLFELWNTFCELWEREESKWRTNVEIDVVFFISLESKHWTFQSFQNRRLTEEWVKECHE